MYILHYFEKITISVVKISFLRSFSLKSSEESHVFLLQQKMCAIEQSLQNGIHIRSGLNNICTKLKKRKEQ